jgi:adenylosuccinate synthase
MRSIEIIVDGQYGSTGKGLLAGYLAKSHAPEVIACALSPNAGHTLILEDGTTLIHRMLPLGIVSPGLKHVILGPGSLIDLDVLHAEILHAQELGVLSPDVPILVHECAAVVLDRHRAAESEGGTAPGSTRKGVGAAQIERIRRRPDENNIIGLMSQDHPIFDRITLAKTADLQRTYLEASTIQVEGCQGYSLSIYHGQYPYVTCRDVTTHSLLADCGMPYMRWSSTNVYGVFRTYPIRVANRPASGEWSGPTYPDSKETTFEAIGQPQELTTVTQLPRRIFTFSHQQAIEAIVQNKVDYAFLNFAQYCPTWEELRGIWIQLNDAAHVSHLGFGPSIADVVRVGSPSVTESHVRQIYERARAATGNRSLGGSAESK